MNKELLAQQLNDKCIHQYGCYIDEATKQQIYKTVCLVVKDILGRNRKDFYDKCQAQDSKEVYYMSMEFLVGTSMRNNITNLGMEDLFIEVLDDYNLDIDELYALEPDAGLGNGGLGRLASCFMDAATTQSYPFTGYSIRYEFGIFKQQIIDGWQMEYPDNWLELGDVWLNRRRGDSCLVKFGGRVHETLIDGVYKAEHVDYEEVLAVPYDLFISGHDSGTVNKLILWSAKSPQKMDMHAFSRGEYVKAIEENTIAESITKVLYPADDHINGKRLRLRQQYLLVCASLSEIIRKHMDKYDCIESLPKKVAIHINDTHPALCVPELMRILLDEFGFTWDKAWDIVQNTINYTNHTVMSEALERWPEFLFNEQLPRIFQIVCEINRRFIEKLHKIYPHDYAKIDYMSIIAHNEVKMANLCLVACKKVNGVSKLHSNILVKSVFKDFYNISPDKFTNVTNGIAYRRWLCQSNPLLTSYLKELIGDGFIENANDLEKLLDYYDNPDVLARLKQIKYENKLRLRDYISKANGIKINPNSMFDIQVKRLHEYKRQLLNALHIMHLYRQLKENPNLEVPARTFIFAAKASAGYIMAKQIIRLIDAISNLVNNDKDVNSKLKVVFIADYKVSLAEIIIPAADISEQISIAGKEASGTGNMKLMMNGAVTVGTLDGANVEILEQVTEENMFLFGMTAPEVDELWRRGYNPHEFLNDNPDLRAVLDMLTSGVLGSDFSDIYNSLLTGHFGTPDAYMTIADFDAYKNTHEKIAKTYLDERKFMNMSLYNIAKSGFFSSDRSVQQYANNIWDITPVK